MAGLAEDFAEKECPKCLALKGRDAFYRDRGQPDGLTRTCKACMGETERAHRQTPEFRKRRNDRIANDPEYRAKYLASRTRYRTSEKGRAATRALDRKRAKTKMQKYRATQLGKAATRRVHQQQKRDHEDRVRAREAVASAVRYGRLVRPLKCSRCGNDGSRCGCPVEIHAHHHRGYARAHWLDVVWVCHRCHDEVEGAEHQ